MNTTCLAVNVAHLEMGQLGASHAGAVQCHQQRPSKQCLGGESSVPQVKQTENDFSSQCDLTRKFLSGAAAVSALGVLGASELLRAQIATSLPDPTLSGIEDIVVVMMENRSLDHFLGWMSKIDGRQAGLKYLDANGQPHSTYHLRDFQGCSHPDPDHSYAGGRVEYDDGKCDGWLRAGSNDIFVIGYYKKADLAFLGTAAPAWTTFSRYFAAMLAETFPNRFYQHSAQTDRPCF